MLSWSRIVDRKRAAAELVSAALEARAQSIAGQLHRADHMRAGNGRCDYCIEEAGRTDVVDSQVAS